MSGKTPPWVWIRGALLLPALLIGCGGGGSDGLSEEDTAKVDEAITTIFTACATGATSGTGGTLPGLPEPGTAGAGSSLAPDPEVEDAVGDLIAVYEANPDVDYSDPDVEQEVPIREVLEEQRATLTGCQPLEALRIEDALEGD